MPAGPTSSQRSSRTRFWRSQYARCARPAPTVQPWPIGRAKSASVRRERISLSRSRDLAFRVTTELASSISFLSRGHFSPLALSVSTARLSCSRGTTSPVSRYQRSSLSRRLAWTSASAGSSIRLTELAGVGREVVQLVAAGQPRDVLVGRGSDHRRLGDRRRVELLPRRLDVVDEVLREPRLDRLLLGWAVAALGEHGVAVLVGLPAEERDERATEVVVVGPRRRPARGSVGMRSMLSVSASTAVRRAGSSDVGSRQISGTRVRTSWSPVGHFSTRP